MIRNISTLIISISHTGPGTLNPKLSQFTTGQKLGNMETYSKILYGILLAFIFLLARRSFGFETMVIAGISVILIELLEIQKSLKK
jgi:hypothetical protein